MNLLHAPSQTPATKDICTHLNRKEKINAYILSFALGAIFFFVPTILIFSLVFTSEYIAFSGGLIIILIVGAKILINKQRMLLINTEYSKAKGYTINDLVKK